MSTDLDLDAIERMIKGMAPEQRAALAEKAKPFLAQLWMPQPGPQMQAYESEADELLYGGAAGGGKTDLLIGLALTQHKRSLLFRRQSNDLDGLWERLTDVAAKVQRTNNSVKKQLRTTDGRVIEGGHLEKPGAERSWQGRPHDLIGVDEGAQIEEFKVAFVTQWLRSGDPNQRCRLVVATNPPIPEYKNGQMADVSTGDWLKRWWAPWLDDTFPNPAEPGELRWCFMRAEGDRLVTIWVDGPGTYDLMTAERIADGVPFDDKAHVQAKSRTFIRSLLKDNAFLRDTGYGARISGSPEPLRSMLLSGDFNVKVEDHPMQVIPTGWILEANQRWEERKHEADRLMQLVLSADIAQGGADTTIIASLLDTAFFEDLLTQPGRLTPTGIEVAQLLLSRRRNGSLIVLDGTGGWGGSTRDMLLTHHRIRAAMCVASAASTAWTKDMQYKLGNIRSEMWWLFREALDPKSGEDICLPPNQRLVAQLAAPHFYVRGKTIFIESKDELRSRIQSSTDEADAVIQAWKYRTQALALRLHEAKEDPRAAQGIRSLADRFGPTTDQADMDNPLGNW